MKLYAYFKAEPTEYVLAYTNGKVVRQGAGQAFWYWVPNTSIALLPTSIIDARFVFNETTIDFQPVTVQGLITYHVVAPETVAEQFNFTIQPQTRVYKAEGQAKLNERLIEIVHTHTRQQLRQLTLEDALRSSERIASSVFDQLRSANELSERGITCDSLFFSSVKATPETTKALEAEHREALQRRADQAIYSRRAEAVEQERKIKQNELATSIALEERRQTLIKLQGENTRQEAEFEAAAEQIRLVPFQQLTSQQLLGLAFRDFAENAQKIGNLTISSEILEQLLKPGSR
ncbi:SPFH domain-containing protein [Tengunoibacter tsumagoiensis]|uniref:Band 7 domain-containing protein n=1 Tax=Tengunoibacter tsumagoiensis TaxID=2014871 RepID=A0A401ZXC2_9CHLR|nr:SPFH domain-containing protein [Tengunoibacter tsumagoiensis]GCE11500.1 hypothetical protein KTT_13590 [Tengunoibacter tsumagoiensis]